MTMGHVVGERTTGQNSRGIDGIYIVVRGLAMQELVDVVAMAKSISGRRDMTSQARALNKLSKGGSMPNHGIWFHRIFGM